MENKSTIMKVNLGEVVIELINDNRPELKTMNCIFTKGFSNGKQDKSWRLIED
jgi:hypothetical protein